MFNILKAILSVLYKGNQLSNVETWKNTQGAVLLVVSILASLSVIIKFFGIEIPLTEMQITDIAEGIVALVSGFLAYLTYATTEKVGLKKKENEVDDPEQGHDLIGKN
jgi:hypothetical protein